MPAAPAVSSASTVTPADLSPPTATAARSWSSSRRRSSLSLSSAARIASRCFLCYVGGQDGAGGNVFNMFAPVYRKKLSAQEAPVEVCDACCVHASVTAPDTHNTRTRQPALETATRLFLHGSNTVGRRSEHSLATRTNHSDW